MASHVAAVHQVLCSLSVCVARWRLNSQWGPGETRKLSLHSYNIICRLFNIAKTDAENLFALMIKIAYERMGILLLRNYL